MEIEDLEMSRGHAAWSRLQELALEARRAGAARRPLEVKLPPEESRALAEVLEAALRVADAVASLPGLQLDEVSDGELAYLAMQGGAFDWLAEEPELYGDEDLQERFALLRTTLRRLLACL
jgi:hypothetical protein